MYCCNCGDKESLLLKGRWCAYCQSPTTRPFDPWGPRKHRRQALVYTRGPLNHEISPLFFTIGFACQGLWWLLRGSAYGIGLCLRGQLRVPLEGWRDIGRGIRTVWDEERLADRWH